MPMVRVCPCPSVPCEFFFLLVFPKGRCLDFLVCLVWRESGRVGPLRFRLSQFFFLEVAR